MLGNVSLATSLASPPEKDRAKLLRSMKRHEAEALLHDWLFWARPTQLPPPGQWRVWLLLAGRGFGKTRTGAEYVRACVREGQARRVALVALVAPTALDARAVMVEGES